MTNPKGEKRDVIGADAVYAQIGESYRHFLNWRAGLLGGYFAVLAGLVGVTSVVGLDHRKRIAGLHALGLVVTLLFWLLEVRNRFVYRKLTLAGQALERRAGLSDKEGPFGCIAPTKAPKETWLTHSRTLDAFFVLALVFFFGYAVWFLSA